MRNPKRFSGSKLTMQEFAEKYHVCGDPDLGQYINVSAEDGRDEGEQLIFNNIQELKDRWIVERNLYRSDKEKRDKEVKELRKEFADVKKAATICTLASAGVAIIFVSVLCTLRLYRSNQYQK